MHHEAARKDFDRLSGKQMRQKMRASSYWKQMLPSNISIVPRYNLVYFQTSKVGCTKIKSLLTALHHHPEEPPAGFNPHYKRETGLIGPASLTHPEFKYWMTSPDVLRFCFVRDPFERLLSAYLDKIRVPINRDREPQRILPRYDQIARSITAKKLGLDSLEGIDTLNHPVSFEDFVQYVCSEDEYDMDRHWHHQVHSTWFELVEFSRVGRLENFDDDMRGILEEVGAPDEVMDRVWGRLNVGDARIPLHEAYSPNTEMMVRDKYRIDFETFDYPDTLPRPSSVAGKPSAVPEQDVTLVATTMERFDQLECFLRSAREHIRPAAIRVALQQDEVKEEYRALGEKYDVDIFAVGFDLGLSASRNELFRSTTTRYVLMCDDDVVFTHNSHIEPAIEVMEAEPDIRVVGGRFLNVAHDREGNTLKKLISAAYTMLHDERWRALSLVYPVRLGVGWRAVGNTDYLHCDFVTNAAALFDRQYLIDNDLLWNEKIKIMGEHVDFYLNINKHEETKVAYTPALFVEHHQVEESAEYRQLRSRREGRSIWMDEHSIGRQLEPENGYSLVLDDKGNPRRISFKGFGE